MGEEDEGVAFSFTEKQRNSSLKNKSYLDSLCRKGGVEKEGFSGVFTKAPDYLIPKEVLSVLQNTPVSGFSEIVKTKDSFFFVFLSNYTSPGTPSLENHWEQLEWFALQEKFSVFFKEWYKNKKEQVYIKNLSSGY